MRGLTLSLKNLCNFNILQSCKNSTEISFSLSYSFGESFMAFTWSDNGGSKNYYYTLYSPQQWINQLIVQSTSSKIHVMLLVLHFWVNLSCTFTAFALFVFLPSLTGRLYSLRPFLLSAKRSNIIEIKCSSHCRMVLDCAFYLRSHLPFFPFMHKTLCSHMYLLCVHLFNAVFNL